MKIKKEARHLLLHMAIGDGSISTSGILRMRHSMAQLEYLLWKKDKLRECGISTTEAYFVDNNGYGAYEVRTYTHKFIKAYRRTLYTPSKNIARRKVLDTLTPLGIAIWYMDDGGLSQRTKDGKVTHNELMINTHLSKEENQVIIDYFKEVWGVSFNQYKNRGKYRLVCGTREARKFVEIVKPYVNEVECMKYKINVKKQPINNK